MIEDYRNKKKKMQGMMGYNDYAINMIDTYDRDVSPIEYDKDSDREKHICPQCGKEFYITAGFYSQWAYKIDKVRYCSYPCMRAVQKRLEQKRNNTTPKKRTYTDEQRKYNTEYAREWRQRNRDKYMEEFKDNPDKVYTERELEIILHTRKGEISKRVALGRLHGSYSNGELIITGKELYEYLVKAKEKQNARKNN